MGDFRAKRVVAFLLLAATAVIVPTGQAFADDDAKSPGSAPGAGARSAETPAAVTPPERIFTAGSAVAPAGGQEVLPTSDAPTPAPPGGFPTHVRPDDPPLADSPAAESRAAAPAIPQTTAAPSNEAPQAPNDFQIFRNTTLDLAANQTSTTDEPSVAQVGNTAFMTGNWWAAISGNGGRTFTHVDPFTAFGGGYGGFCCDQVAIYSPVVNATAWVLQYQVDGAGNNAERIAVSVGEPNLQAVSFFFADITPQQIGQPNGVWADFPHVAVNAGFFYLTYNMFNASGAYVGTAINRVPLADLADGGGFGYNFFTTTLGTTVPVSGAGSTMYLGTHLDNDTLRIWSWPDSSSSFGQNDVDHTGFNSGSYTCTTNDGFNPCGRSNSRVRGGWVGRGILGFSWDAGQGSQGLGTFPFPYTFVVRINQSTFGLIDQPIIWSTGHAWFYGGVGANGRGDVGMSIAIAGGATYPGSQILIADDIGGPWQGGFFVASSTNSPASNRWGDYFSTRAINGTGNAWVGASYVLVGPCAGGGVDCDNVRVHYTVFGRERDYSNCPDDFFEPDGTPGQSLLLTPTVTSSGHAFCSTNDEDWFRFSGVGGNQYRIETLNLGGGNDTILTLYDSSLTQLAIDDDGSPEFRASLINYVASNSGTYYVKATRFLGFRSFGYTYDVRITRDTPPAVSAPVTAIRNGSTLSNPSSGVYGVLLNDAWTRSDPDGIASQQLQQCLNSGCSFTDVSPQPLPTDTAYAHRPIIGTQLQRRIRAFDPLGAFSPYATGPQLSVVGVQQDASSFTYAGTWTTASNSAFYGGTLSQTSGGTGTKTTLQFTGQSVGVVGERRKNGGKADVFIDGVNQGVIDFYAGTDQDRRIVFAASGLPPTRPDGSAHVLEVRWRSDQNPSSTGRVLYIDGATRLAPK